MCCDGNREKSCLVLEISRHFSFHTNFFCTFHFSSRKFLQFLTFVPKMFRQMNVHGKKSTGCTASKPSGRPDFTMVAWTSCGSSLHFSNIRAGFFLPFSFSFEKFLQIFLFVPEIFDRIRPGSRNTRSSGQNPRIPPQSPIPSLL